MVPKDWDGGGAGLLLVDRLSDRWGICDGRSRVWFELGL
jgi:hypothetical protein